MTKSIILIHGLFMNSLVMKFMEKQFKTLGYSVYHFTYKTVKYSDATLEDLDNLVKSIHSDKLHIVGHSMGGLVARMYVDKYQHKDVSIVTVGTPHQTSRLGIYLNQSVIGKIFGTSGSSGIVNKLPAWNNNTPMGCIAGVFPIGLNSIFKGVGYAAPSDGTVFLDEATLENCSDKLVVKASHTGLIYNKDVVSQCHYFFQNKKFNKTI